MIESFSDLLVASPLFALAFGGLALMLVDAFVKDKGELALMAFCDPRRRWRVLGGPVVHRPRHATPEVFALLPVVRIE